MDKSKKKQSKLTDFVTKQSSEAPSHTGTTRKSRMINMNMLVNVNMTSRFGKKEAKTFYFVSAIPVTQSSSITSTASSSTLGQSRTEDEIESTTMNVNVTLNVTAEGK